MRKKMRFSAVLLSLTGVLVFWGCGNAVGIDDVLTKAKKEGKVVMVELGSVGCIPCEQMKPVMEKLRTNYKGKLEVLFVDVRKDRENTRRFRVTMIHLPRYSWIKPAKNSTVTFTEGNPFLLAIISSPENIKNLDKIREMSWKIAHPQGLKEAEVQEIISKGKTVIAMSMSLHASEIGGTQMAPELAYEFATSQEYEEARKNTVLIMFPSFNPDGQIMVTDWYNKWLGTEYAGCSLPWLYHKYVGHDNNRDAFMTNMIESKYMAKIMFKDWTPQAYVDHHHMGSYGARLFVEPYCEPIHPNADPLIWREHSWYGAYKAYKLEENGKTGIINDAMFASWGHLGFHWITAYHNIAKLPVSTFFVVNLCHRG